MLLFFKKHGIAVAICFFTFLLLSYFAYYNQLAEGDADNYWHFFFSKYAFQYPQFFLHHWGKPIFILFSSPFSQFGFYSLKLFNITCGILTAIITYKFAIALKLRFSWMVILVLLFTPLYFLVLQSGLTEPLMSLFLITVFYLLYKENFLPAAILMSFSLYVRTEGLFLIIYVLLYLVLIRKWKFIPFLFTGFILYSFVGLIAGHDFLWYFTENPYSAISPYGHGKWDHFFLKYDTIWGLPLTIFMVLGLLMILIVSAMHIKKIFSATQHPAHKILLLVVAPMLLFFIFHMVSWTYGLFGSIGLERVLASVSPFCALICCIGLNYLLDIKLPYKIPWLLAVIFSYFMIKSTFKLHHYPLKAYGSYKVMFEMGKWFANVDPNCRVYYAHPGIIFTTDRNPFDKKLNNEEFGLTPDNIEPSQQPTYIFWDSQFSENNCGVKLQTLETAPNLIKIKEMEDLGFRVIVFKVK